MSDWNLGWWASASEPEEGGMNPSWLDRPVRESTFGSVEEVRKMEQCYHEWEPARCTILGYIKVLARCRRCGTCWGKPDGR